MIHSELERLHGIMEDCATARALNRENLIQDAQNRANTYNQLTQGAMNLASNMWGAFKGTVTPQTNQPYPNQPANPSLGYPQQQQGGFGSNFGQANPYGTNPYGAQPNNGFGSNPYGQNPYGQPNQGGFNPYGQNPQGGQNPYGGRGY